MRQRVALMRTFMFERDLMLLDEPFGAFDSLTRSLMQRWLLEVWEQHRRTVLSLRMTSTRRSYLGDRVVVMTARPGRVKLRVPRRPAAPRAPALLTSPEFTALKRRLLDAIEEESLKAFSGHDE